MQSSNAPSKIQLPFAASGTKNTIPVPSQQGITAGAASYTDGFPPLTFTPLSAGGVPPAGADFNGILNSITALQQWKSAGGHFPFDATFAAAIGGYPKGALIARSDTLGFWINTIENNTSNPDTGGAGWLGFSPNSVQSGAYNTSIDVGSVNAYAMNTFPAYQTLQSGMIVILEAIQSTNTGGATLNVNSSGALPILGMGSIALQGGELVASSSAVFILKSDKSAWILVNTTNGAFPVSPGTRSNQAVNLGQLGDGSLSPTFAQTIVSAATATNQAVNLGQFSGVMSTNGYVKLPGGLIFQWGQQNVAAQSTQVVTTPIAFPNAAFARYASIVQSSMFYNTYSGVGCSYQDLSHIVLQNLYTSLVTINYLTIGN